MGLKSEFEKTLREKFIGNLDPHSSKSILFERIALPLLVKESGVKEYERVCEKSLSGLSVAKEEDLEVIFEKLNITTRFFSNCSQLPKNQCIIASNHPTGPLDGLFMQSVFNYLGLRGKTMGDDIMNGLPQMKDAYIGLSIRVNGKSRLSQLRNIKKEILGGLSLGLFPSGSVSQFDIKKGKVRDIKWNTGFIEMAKSNNLDIIPVYIDVKLSFWHYFFKAVYQDLASLRLFKEALKFIDENKGRCVDVYIGQPISIDSVEPTQEDALKIQHICENLKYQQYTVDV